MQPKNRYTDSAIKFFCPQNRRNCLACVEKGQPRLALLTKIVKEIEARTQDRPVEKRRFFEEISKKLNCEIIDFQEILDYLRGRGFICEPMPNLVKWIGEV